MPHHPFRSTRMFDSTRPVRSTLRSAAGILLTVGALAACSLSSGGSTTTSSSSPGAAAETSGTSGTSGTPGSQAPASKPCPDGGTVQVATHDSFKVPDAALAAFTAQTGCRVQILKNGDAGQLTTKLVLTKNSPIADAVYGIDNTYAGRAVAAGLLTAYTPAQMPPGVKDHAATGAGAGVLTPVDYGDVCVNIDDTWFAASQIVAPKTFEDLTKPSYKDLFVTPSPATSSPGMAFFLATVATYGEDGWKDYWTKLKANGAKTTSGWSDAYFVDFTQGGGKGTRPIVLSYASSPPFTIPKGKTRPTTSALLDTCFRQTEYAGVLAGAKNEAGAKAFVDFLLSSPVQVAIPDNMYMYPVVNTAPLPATWATWAKLPASPLSVAPEVIDAKRDSWLKAWTELMGS